MPRLTLQAKPETKFVRKGLEDLRKDMPRVARARMWKAMQWIKKKMSYTQNSPPKRSGQKYVRTFNMMQKYRIGKTGAGNYYFEAAAPYSKYVLGDARGIGQAWMHKDRWFTMRGMIEWVVARLPKSVIRALKFAVPNLSIKGDTSGQDEFDL